MPGADKTGITGGLRSTSFLLMIKKRVKYRLQGLNSRRFKA